MQTQKKLTFENLSPLNVYKMYPEIYKDNVNLLFHNRTGIDVSPEKDLKRLYVDTTHLNSTMLKQTINKFRKSMTTVIDNKIRKS